WRHHQHFAAGRHVRHQRPRRQGTRGRRHRQRHRGALPMRYAIYKITLGGQDMTHKIKPRFMGLTLTECRGGEADQLDLTLDDADGKLAIPPKGEKIELQIGWSDT